MDALQVYGEAGFEHLFKNATHSDVNVRLSTYLAVPSSSSSSSSSSSTFATIAEFPAHKVLLQRCPHFKDQLDHNCAPGLLLNPAHQLKAAEAVILAGPYGSLALLLEQEQLPASEDPSADPQAVLWDAVLLADVLRMPAVAIQAERVLLRSLEKWRGPSVQLLRRMLLLRRPTDAWPDCTLLAVAKVLELFFAKLPRQQEQESLLVAKLMATVGDIPWTLASPKKTTFMLQLPLEAMALLIASDGLQVTSEDDVLYIVQLYLQQHYAREDAAAAAAAKPQMAAAALLVPLVRCRLLSLRWVAHAVLCDSAATDSVLRKVFSKQQLQELLLVMSAAAPAEPPSVQSVAREVSGAPASWLLEERGVSSLGDISRLVWEVPVSEVAAACQRATIEKGTCSVVSELLTPAMRGFTFGLNVLCVWDDDKDGVDIGLSLFSSSDVLVTVDFEVQCCELTDPTRHRVMMGGKGSQSIWDVSFFGAMPGGGWQLQQWTEDTVRVVLDIVAVL